MEALYIALTGFFCVVCFIIGAKVGQTIVKGERIEIPKFDPLKSVRESKARKVVEQEQDKLSKILRNIERYDGTSKGQGDVR